MYVLRRGATHPHMHQKKQYILCRISAVLTPNRSRTPNTHKIDKNQFRIIAKRTVLFMIPMYKSFGRLFPMFNFSRIYRPLVRWRSRSLSFLYCFPSWPSFQRCRFFSPFSLHFLASRFYGHQCGYMSMKLIVRSALIRICCRATSCHSRQVYILSIHIFISTHMRTYLYLLYFSFASIHCPIHRSAKLMYWWSRLFIACGQL